MGCMQRRQGSATAWYWWWWHTLKYSFSPILCSSTAFSATGETWKHPGALRSTGRKEIRNILRNHPYLNPFPCTFSRATPTFVRRATLQAPRSIFSASDTRFVLVTYWSPRGVSWLEVPPGECPRTTKRPTELVILLQGVWPLYDTDGEVMSTESPQSTGSGANGLRLISHNM